MAKKKAVSKTRRANNEGSIFQRSDGRWGGALTMGYDENGKIISIYAAGEIARKTPVNISLGDESFIEFSDGTIANIHKTAYNRMSAARSGETMAFSFDMFGNVVACIDDNLKTLAVIAAVPTPIAGSNPKDMILHPAV